MPTSIKSINPATNTVIEGFPAHDDTQVDQMIDHAHEAYLSWRREAATDRAAVVCKAAQLLRERSDLFAGLITREMGKLIAESEYEVELAASILNYYAEHGPDMLADAPITVNDGTAVIQTRPLGVLLGVMPWNFPLYQVVRFVGPNLVAGNVIHLKHASSCPRTAIELETLFRDAGAPAGVYTNLLIAGKDVGRIVENPLVQGASLTGSEAAGASLGEIAGRALKKSVLELGGSDPLLILERANLEHSIAAALSGRMANTGQSCIAAKRLIVVQDAYDDFLATLVEQMSGLAAGDPADRATPLGPLSSEQAATDITDQIRTAVKEGATVVTGGRRIDRHGAYLEPTVLTDVTKGMTVYEEELFGPVAVVYNVVDEDEAIRLANDTDFGLGASVFTTDPNQAARVAEQLDVGMVWINHPTATSPELPFGGIKRSGFGRELSTYGMSEFVNKKLIRTLPHDTPIGTSAG